MQEKIKKLFSNKLNLPLEEISCEQETYSFEMFFQEKGFRVGVVVNSLYNELCACIGTQRYSARFSTVADEEGINQALQWLVDMRG